MSPKWYLVAPFIPKLIGVATLAAIGGAAAAELAAPASPAVDVFGELWAMAKAAGVLGFVVVYWLWTNDSKRRDAEAKEVDIRHDAELADLRKQLAEARAELKTLQQERNSLHERSLTALINLDKTMEDQTKVTTEMVKSTQALIQWLRHREKLPPEV